MPDLGAGRIFAERYELIRPLASGGMSTVHEARHVVSGRAVALKILRPDAAQDEALAERFRREARAPAEIGHPSIVDVTDAGYDFETGSLFVVMELLRGETLRARLRRPGLVLGELLRVALDTLDGLAAAHAKGFVHRDLKPGNIFLEEGEPPRVRLLDFGLVRGPGARTVTRGLTPLGTPSYMSPEQVRNPAGCGPPTDVWAMGVILYEALAGRRPFVGEQRNAVVLQIVTTAATPLTDWNPDVPRALASTVDRCLRADPEERLADASELRRVLSMVRRGLARDASGLDWPLPRRLSHEEAMGTPAAPRLPAPTPDQLVRDTVRDSLDAEPGDD